MNTSRGRQIGDLSTKLRRANGALSKIRHVCPTKSSLKDYKLKKISVFALLENLN